MYQPLQVTFRPIDNLGQRTDAALIILGNTIRSLDDGSIHERSRQQPPNCPVFYNVVSDVTDSDIATVVIRNAYLEIIRAFVDFVDGLLGMRKMASMPFTLDRDIRTAEEWEAFLKEEIRKRTLKVGRDGHTSNHQKAASLGGLPSVFLAEAVDGYFDIRSDLEHHKGVARKDLVFRTQSVGLFVDGTELVNLGQAIEQGQVVSQRVVYREYRFAKGDEIVLSEYQIHQLAATILEYISKPLVRVIAPPPQSKAS